MGNHSQAYLLGLLAKIKCSICSYQLNLWYLSHVHGSSAGLARAPGPWPRFCTTSGCCEAFRATIDQKKESSQKKGKFPKKKEFMHLEFFFSLTVVRFLEQRYYTFLLTFRRTHSPWRFGASVPIDSN